ncbi:MAG: SBBP repeat-containing protein [Acidobacteria bacterium]|nr:SBBP repeat-containing protein [Acidobacteriota bacterium]
MTAVSAHVTPGQASRPEARGESKASLDQLPTRRRPVAFGQLSFGFEQNIGQFDHAIQFLGRGSGYQLALTGNEIVLQLEKAKERKRNGCEEVVGDCERLKLPPSAFCLAPSSSAGSPIRNSQQSKSQNRAELSSPARLSSPQAVSQRERSDRDFTRSSERSIILDAASVRQAATVKMKFIGANAASHPVGVDVLPSKSNYFIGNDAKQWRTNISTFAKVNYANLYRGVDLLVYQQQGTFEYDLKLAVGADFKAIAISIEGAQALRIDEQGDLIFTTSAGELRQQKPVAYQEVNGERQAVTCNYKLLNAPVQQAAKRKIRKLQAAIRNQIVAFELDEHDKRLPLVIDPVLDFSTHFGSAPSPATFNATDVALDQEGNMYVVGNELFAPIPQAVESAQAVANRNSVFVAKLDAASQSLVYATFFGSDAFADRTSTYFGASIAVDFEGKVYMTGYTSASAFPTTPGAFQTSLKGAENAFVSKLNRDGNALIYSTYLGAADTTPAGNTCAIGTRCSTKGFAIKVDSFGNAYLTGQTNVRSFPTTANAFKPVKSNDVCSSVGGDAITLFPCTEAFVSKLNPSGNALVYSTFLGGNGNDSGNGIAVDDSGNAYIVGTTEAQNFPIKDALYANFIGGKNDAFVTKLNAAGSALIYSTYLGGKSDDAGKSIAVDVAGSAYVCGDTFSADLPVTANVLQREIGNAPFFKTTDGGLHWQPVRRGLSSNLLMQLLAVDPNVSSTIYAGTNSGVFKSTDSGNSWSGALPVGFPFRQILAFAPQNPSVVFASTIGAFPLDILLKSTDGGNTWIRINSPSPAGVLVHSIIQVTIDPTDLSTFYVAARTLQPTVTLFKTTDGGTSWQAINKGLPQADAAILGIDPKNPSTLYAQSIHLFKSASGGKKWQPTSIIDIALADVAFDPAKSSQIYASGNGLFKSSDGGESWSEIENNLYSLGELLIDPTNSAILYTISSGKIYKSMDGGTVWKAINLNPAAVSISLAMDPKTPSTLYTGTNNIGTDAFVMKLNAQGSALDYCTYLGGYDSDSSASIAVDSSFNAYLTGTTNSDDFPTRNAFQPDKRNEKDAFNANEAFVVKLNPLATAAIYSSYLGGNNSDSGNGIAIDKSGRVYVVGSTRSTNFPTINSLQPFHRPGDAFISRLVDLNNTNPAPTVSSVMPNSGSASGQTAITINGTNFLSGAAVSIGGVLATEVVVVNSNTIRARTDTAFSAGVKNLFVINSDGQSGALNNGFSYLLTPTILGAAINNNRLGVDGIGFNGYGFDKGAVILIDGNAVPTLNDRNFPQVILLSKKALKKINPGQRVVLQVRNVNGLVSEPFAFTRP